MQIRANDINLSESLWGIRKLRKVFGHKRSMHSQCWIMSSSSAFLSLPLLTAEQDIRGAEMGLGGISVQGREDREHWWMPAVSHGIPAQQFASCATPGTLISHLFAELECGIGNYKYTLHFYGNSVRQSLSRHTFVRYTYMTVLYTGGIYTCQPASLMNIYQYPNSKNQTIRLEENIMALLFFLDKLEKKWSRLKVEY